MNTKRMQSYRLSTETIEAIDALAEELGVSKAEAITRAVAALGAARRCGEHLADLADGARALVARDEKLISENRNVWSDADVQRAIAHAEGDEGLIYAYQDAARLLAAALAPYLGDTISWAGRSIQ